MSGSTFWARQPWKAFYTAFAIVRALVQVPSLMLLYILPNARPHRLWTWRQALVRSLVRLFFEYAAAVELRPPFSLEPGREKDRWVTLAPIQPGDSGAPASEPLYQGVASGTSEIRPVTIGANWFPRPLSLSQPHQPGQRVFLHFHPGAYVLLGCRDADIGHGASLLLQASPGSVVFCPQYRLSSVSYPHGHFPAALQDAITAYAHLLFRLNVPPQDIIFSGDSAGGHLALALLRYINAGLTDGPQHRILPKPAGVLLWSPWVDLTQTSGDLARRPLERVDLLPPKLLEWGCRVFVPPQLDGDKAGGRAHENPYISPVRQAIVTQVPIWVSVCGAELFRDDILRFAEVQRQGGGGGRLRTWETPNAPHDMFAGVMLGWGEEAGKAAEDALRFLEATA